MFYLFFYFQVLDELYDILRTLQCTCQLPRAHEFLQELRDISSMAMEHFEEKIVPSLKQKMPSVRLTLGNFNVNTEPEAGNKHLFYFSLLLEMAFCKFKQSFYMDPFRIWVIIALQTSYLLFLLAIIDSLWLTPLCLCGSILDFLFSLTIGHPGYSFHQPLTQSCEVGFMLFSSTSLVFDIPCEC